MVLSGMVVPPRGYWIKSSMTAARSIHPVNRRVFDHGVPACAFARRIPASLGDDTVLRRSLSRERRLKSVMTLSE